MINNKINKTSNKSLYSTKSCNQFNSFETQIELIKK